MLLIPLVETTEPRYAEIARIMAETGDWITPWFDYGTPFWGKPPLSFWSQAAAIKALGASEFAVRLPSLLATLAICAFIFRIGILLAGRTAAWFAVLIYFTSASGYLLSGAVLTDPFLTLATTLALLSIIKMYRDPECAAVWRYTLFLALGIGLLAKGPIAVVLVGGPLGLWLVLDWRAGFRVIPWLTGVALMLLIALPWYIAAELKTSGFLDYFIVGEHFKRFLDPGWNGDLYGSAHRYARGTIWWFATWATLPWGFIALALFFKRLLRSNSANISRQSNRSGETVLLLLWTLWPLVFFTFAGNVLWTYVQPALPPFAILLASVITRLSPGRVTGLAYAALVLPIGTLVLTLASGNANWGNDLKTEKSLVEYVASHAPHSHRPPALYYLGDLPFSARFYSHGHARHIDGKQISAVIEESRNLPSYVAIPNRELARPGMISTLNLSEPVFQNGRYSLFEFDRIDQKIAWNGGASSANESHESPRQVSSSTRPPKSPGLRSGGKWLPSMVGLLPLLHTQGP
ncbi:ArnT family glycosyltransferase [Parahaliea maris]|nr:glycosyltransferase family 39 protein [Parahaliea maris]